jgi:toxin-antitoxin system PIN domain toxin
MNLLVDTNLLVYAVYEESPHHQAARAFVEKHRRSGGFCVTWSILYEWLRVVTHPRVFSRPLDPSRAVAFIETLVDDPKVDVLLETDRHPRFMVEVLSSAPPLRGNMYHDAHIAALMREHGVGTIATADRHFRVFPFLTVVDPTAESE